MRVVLLSEFFCKNMGYLENMLPKYLARLGVQTHVIATGLRPHSRRDSISASYDDFLQPLHPGATETLDGFTLHILRHKKAFGYTRMMGLWASLKTISPTVVQTMSVTGWIPLDAALFKLSLGYKLFTGSHHHVSVFPLAQKAPQVLSAERLTCALTRGLPGGLVSLATEKCYAISPDCAYVATRFFGVPMRKVQICPLGVDTDIFYPMSTKEDHHARHQLRNQLGFSDSEIVCVYSGRFSEDKNPLILARAIHLLRRSKLPFRGLFIGNGPQANEIQKCCGCVIRPFVPVSDLGKFYRAAEIGVWPTQESMSMLDAAACGLPVVVNHTLSAKELIDGNGVTYTLNDVEDLVRVLSLLSDLQTRQRLGSLGAIKMSRDFSWEMIAKRRLLEYEAVLSSDVLLRSKQDARPERDRVF